MHSFRVERILRSIYYNTSNDISSSILRIEPSETRVTVGLLTSMIHKTCPVELNF